MNHKICELLYLFRFNKEYIEEKKENVYICIKNDKRQKQEIKNVK